MYYVYELIDPRDSLPFYVGKGQRDRVRQHEKEAIRGVISAKCNRIRAILKAKLKVSHRIVRRFEFEADAYSFETEHIDAIGITNLTNVMLGGGSPNTKGNMMDDKIMGRALWKIGAKTQSFTIWPKRLWGFDIPTMPACVVIKFGLMFDRILRRRGLEWCREHCGAITGRAVVVRFKP